jgi:hypothetical protein
MAADDLPGPVVTLLNLIVRRAKRCIFRVEVRDLRRWPVAMGRLKLRAASVR